MFCKADFTNVIENNKPECLESIHLIVWGKVPNTNLTKVNLRRFNGFATAEANVKAETIAKDLNEEQLEQVCNQLDIDFNGCSNETVCLKIVQKLTAQKKNISKSASRNDMDNKSVLSSVSRKSEKLAICKQIEKIDEQYLELLETVCKNEEKLDNCSFKNNPLNEEDVRHMQRQIRILNAKLASIESKKKSLLVQQEEEEGNIGADSENKSSYTKQWVEDVIPEKYEDTVSIKTAVEAQEISDLKAAMTNMMRQSSGIKLPDFNGVSSMAWNNFIMQYNVTTNKCRISDEENILRLSQHLKGEAREKVDLLLMSAKSPEPILKILQNHYGGDEKVLKELITKSENVSYVDSLDKFAEFNYTVQNVSSAVNQIDSDLYDTQKLLALFIEKLPQHIVMQWASHLLAINTNSKKVKFNYFSNWIQSLAGVISDVTFFTNINVQRKKGFYENVKYERETIRGDPDTSNNATEYERRCRICKVGEHNLEKCSEFLKLNCKRRWETVKKIKYCFCCLKTHRGQCKKRVQCKIPGCERFHHELLHKSEVQNENITATCSNEGCQVLLKMLPVQVKGPKGVLHITALLDEGSTLTLLDKSVSDMIGLHGEKSPLCFKWTGGIYRNEPNSENVELGICSQNGTVFNEMKNIKTIANLELPYQRFDYDSMLKKYPQIKQFNIAHHRDKPLLLIGQNHASMIVSREVIEIESNGPIITKTKLGWAVQGPVTKSSEAGPNFVCCQIPEDNLERLINNHFELENFGVSAGMNKDVLSDNERSIRVAENSIKKVGNQYEVALPWKDDSIVGESKSMAFQRFYCIERKLQKDKKLRDAYKEQIDKLLERGYAMQIKFSDLKGKRSWFLPHFAVSNPKKPHKKPRIVFDAAAKVNNISLNDQLLAGPDWLSSIIGILIRFRERSIAFAGDICEMFNRVNIADKDTFMQCFLWRDTPKKPVEVYKMKAMLFGLNCSPFLAQFVKNYNASQHKDTFPDAYEAILKNHYVDDYLDSTETEDEAIELINKVVEVHARGGFQIRSFISNSQKVINSLPNHLIDEKMFTSFDKSNFQKVLGLTWDANTDTFKFIYNFHRVNQDVMNNKKVPTKREVLTAVMSVYDPLGLLTPITIKGRLIMKDVWKTKIGWDDVIPDQIVTAWNNWLQELKSVSSLNIPRCYNTSIKHPIVELHVFNDASLQAFCSAAYFRFIDGDTYNTSLVLAKAKVVPESRRSTTIPKLELIAAVMGMRLAKTILNETRIKISKTVYWTDSSVVLCWIKNNKVLKPFEAVRVNEILENTEAEQWRWIATKKNVADLGTKFHRDGLVDTQWFTGPEFLMKCDEHWNLQEPSEQLCEQVVLAQVEDTLTSNDHLPKIERFSKLNRLIRSTAWVNRFIQNCKNLTKGEEVIKGDLKVEEVEFSTLQWIKAVQIDCFPEDMKKAEGLSHNKSKLLLSKQLTTLDSNGVLRISGRIDRAVGVIPETKQPYVLDGHHYFTNLLIMKIHQEFNHFGTQIVINQFRRKYYISKMIRRIKNVIHHCLYCHVKKSKELEPQMGKLPDVRFYTNLKAFTATGIDYFGPFYVKNGRKVEARYGVLFTCMTTRAIHVEVAHSLNTDSCIMAIRRMMATRGKIKEMLSDNGTNFRGANRELLEALEELDETVLENELVQYKIKWKFNPPLAPNFGGCWERLIGCFKKALEFALSVNRHPTDEMLETIFKEAQYIINCRPYIIESSDLNDDFQQTPNDILIPHNITLHPCGNFENDKLSRQKWRISQHLIDNFWNKFTKSYIPTLLETKKWIKSVKNLVEGDIVKVKENLPRGQWPLGKVLKTFPGDDGIVRAVDILMGGKIFRRPTNKLCRLEVAEGWSM